MASKTAIIYDDTCILLAILMYMYDLVLAKYMLTLFLPSNLSNDRFVNPCLFAIYIFERHRTLIVAKLSFTFSVKKLDILHLIINFYFLNFDGSGSSDSNMIFSSNTKL